MCEPASHASQGASHASHNMKNEKLKKKKKKNKKKKKKKLRDLCGVTKSIRYWCYLNLDYANGTSTVLQSTRISDCFFQICSPFDK